MCVFQKSAADGVGEYESFETHLVLALSSSTSSVWMCPNSGYCRCRLEKNETDVWTYTIQRLLNKLFRQARKRLGRPQRCVRRHILYDSRTCYSRAVHSLNGRNEYRILMHTLTGSFNSILPRVAIEQRETVGCDAFFSMYCLRLKTPALTRKPRESTSETAKTTLSLFKRKPSFKKLCNTKYKNVHVQSSCRHQQECHRHRQ